MDQAKLFEVLEAHKLWLRVIGGERANLTGADLTGVNLSRANLSGADLNGADLNGVNLSVANLSWVKLPVGWCKWSVTQVGESIQIGCKLDTIENWDRFFSDNCMVTYETGRDTEDFKRIKAAYSAARVYVLAMK